MSVSTIRNNCRKLFLNRFMDYRLFEKCIRNNTANNSQAFQPLDLVLDEPIKEKKKLTFVLQNTDNRVEKQVFELVKVLEEFNINKNEAFEAPGMFYKPPKILRYNGLTFLECGITNFTAKDLVLYHTYMKKKTVSNLQSMKLLPEKLDIRSKLCECFSLWPKNLHPASHESDNLKSLSVLRFEVMQQYLEWRIQMTEEEFTKVTQIYNFFKHRPLRHIEENITIAKERLKMSVEQIKKYPFVVAVDPANTQQILDQVKILAGTDAAQILNIYPTIMRSSWESINIIKGILKANNITPAMQRRAYLIYTLKPETLVKRFNELQQIPEFQAQSSNKRALLMVLYMNKVMKRLDHLQTINKQCTVLHKLIHTDNNFDSYAQDFGDRSSIKDLAYAISGGLANGKNKSSEESIAVYKYVKNQIERHQHIKCVPVVTVYNTIKKLLDDFTKEDLLANCQLVLYPLETIMKHWELLSEKIKHPTIIDSSRHSDSSSDSEEATPFINDENDSNFAPEVDSVECEESNQGVDVFAGINYESINTKQKLSLLLYSLEKEHYFSGNGIWDGFKVIKDNS